MYTVGEGKTSTHVFTLTDKDGDPITSVEGLKYTVLEGVAYGSAQDASTILDWTNLSLILSAEGTGEVEVPGPLNRLSASDMVMRYLTIMAIHDGGDQLPVGIEYRIIPTAGVTPGTEPLV